MKIDDPVGAVAVHGVNGTFGTLAVGLFDTSEGLFTTGGTHLLLVQLLGVVVVSVWGASLSSDWRRCLNVQLVLELQQPKKRKVSTWRCMGFRLTMIWNVSRINRITPLFSPMELT